MSAVRGCARPFSVRRFGGALAVGAVVAAGAIVGASPAAAVTKPATPTNVFVTAGDGTATFGFTQTPAADDGGAPISGYLVSAFPANGSASVNVTCTATAMCPKLVLINGWVYTLTVESRTGTNPTNYIFSQPSAPSAPFRPGVTPQTITFANPGTQTFGATPALTASADSGLPVTLTSLTTSVCAIDASNELTFASVGTCTIDADQSGDATRRSAATVQRSFTVQKATPTLTVTASASPTVYGQPLAFTAALTSPAVGSGTVQWTVNGTAPAPATTSPIGLNGTATYTPSPTLAPGSYQVKAGFVGDANDDAATSNTVTQVVDRASTSTSLVVSGNTLTATVAPVLPGAGTPSGTVAFTAGGVAAGTGTIGAGGVATATATNVGDQAVVATYSGDANFSSSTGSRAQLVPPMVTTQVTSAHAKTKYGWYRSSVQVAFTCTAGTSPVASCPVPVVLSNSGARQSVTQTATGTDGAATTTSVASINIDLVAPKLHVTRHGNKLTCKGSDALSGIATCKIVHHDLSTRRGVTRLHWTAVATDKAGNQTTKRGYDHYADQG